MSEASSIAVDYLARFVQLMFVMCYIQDGHCDVVVWPFLHVLQRLVAASGQYLEVCIVQYVNL
jgi:hypothetical protein